MKQKSFKQTRFFLKLVNKGSFIYTRIFLCDFLWNMANRKQVNESKNGGQKMGRTLFEPCTTSTTQIRPKQIPSIYAKIVSKPDSYLALIKLYLKASDFSVKQPGFPTIYISIQIFINLSRDQHERNFVKFSLVSGSQQSLLGLEQTVLRFAQ